MLARRIFWLVVLVGSAALCSCTKPPQPMAEEPVAPQKSEAASPPLQPQETPGLPAPKLEQVQEAVNRVFKDAVVIDVSRKPCFLVGDYNGDESQDLAVVLKPAEGRLAELNQEFPNWIAREPLEEVLLPKSRVLTHRGAVKHAPDPAAGQTIRFEQRDVLLAIIHGHGPKGWHDLEATQTHLMRDVVGANMRILPFKEAVKVYKGANPFPTIYGDLIAETLIGQSGFLHFAGSIYGWYDPKSYRPKAGPAHPAMASRR